MRLLGSALFITIPTDAILISPPTPSVCVPIVIVSTPEVGIVSCISWSSGIGRSNTKSNFPCNSVPSVAVATVPE